jgi:hypothetical protein
MANVIKAVCILAVIVAFLTACTYVVLTSKTPEQMDAIERESVQFAKYCYDNSYQPAECK